MAKKTEERFHASHGQGEIEPLLKALDDEYWVTQVQAIHLLQQHFAEHRDFRIIQALAAFLGEKKAATEVRVAAMDALSALKKHVDGQEQRYIERAFQQHREKENEKEQALLHVDLEPGEPFTFETYKAFASQVESMVTRYRTPLGNVSVGNVPKRLMIELPPLYQSNLPVYVLARCPICGGRVSEPVDTFSLSGLGWWLSEPSGFGWLGRRISQARNLDALMVQREGGPSYRSECGHARAVTYGVNLHGIIPDDVRMTGYIVIGSERPGVLRPFMERQGSHAVIHALPVGRLDDVVWQPRYTAYFVCYFTEDADAFEESLAPQDWYSDKFVWPYDQMDYDLVPWLDEGKLFWMGPEVEGHPLRQGPASEFPYGNVDGLVGRWMVSQEKGAKLLPQVSGHSLYSQSHVGFRQVKPIEEEALRQREFRSIRREQVGRIVEFARRQGHRPLLDMDLKKLDLSGMDLAGAILAGKALLGTDLSGANLQGIDGQGVYLAKTNLVGVDLSEACLDGINAVRADLSGVNLRGASLREAKLKWAKLVGADLSGADLTGADLGGADLAQVRYDECTRWPADFTPPS
ncbi:MAG: pentapeptide repeat-containing protein [Anaerolineae bacterium]